MIIYACSTNPGKLREFRLGARQSGAMDLVLEPLPDLKQIRAPEEDGATFEENASSKALYYSAFTPELVLADDSGLEVDALRRAPGVYSARYAGVDATDFANNDLLLRKLQNVGNREAHFVCALALARGGRVLATARGIAEGEILTVPRGEGGFGYDPLFFYPPLGRTFAELTPEEKFGVSHRGKALRNLFGCLENISQHGLEFSKART